MIVKPAVTPVPVIVTTSGTVSTSPREVASIHYLNTTAGVGRVDITTGGAGTNGITLGAGVASGTDNWNPAQPARFEKLIVTFTTGTGIVTIQYN
jgi:hypothetical protein